MQEGGDSWFRSLDRVFQASETLKSLRRCLGAPWKTRVLCSALVVWLRQVAQPLCFSSFISSRLPAEKRSQGLVATLWELRKHASLFGWRSTCEHDALRSLVPA